MLNADPSPWLSHAASLALHLGVMAVLALLVPPPVADGETDAETVAWIHHMLVSAGTGTDDAALGDSADHDDGASGGHPAEGVAGSPAPKSPLRPTPHADDRGLRGGAIEEATTFGMIGLLADHPGGGSNAPPSPWGRAATGGSGLGGAWGDGIGDVFGGGGLGLSGVGEGSGGIGEALAIGDVGTVGHGLGMSGTGEGFGIGCGCGGRGWGRIGGSHQTRAPSLRCGPLPGEETAHGAPSGCATKITGRLPPEVIQRIVRQSFGRFRVCYEDALRGNPSLEGRVSVKFVIDRQGSVSMAADAGSDLADAGVVSCVVRGFSALSFPEPEGGIVTVVYPLVLSPGATP
jgi:hypothetical protein